MDISKELEIIKNTKEPFAGRLNIFDQLNISLREQKNEIDKKMHLIGMLEVVEWLKVMSDANYFKECDISSLEIVFNYDVDYVEIDFKNKNGSYIKKDLKGKNYIENLDSILGNSYCQQNCLNKDFRDGISAEIDVCPGFEEKVLDLLLSKELKTFLDYGKLNIEVANNSATSKKSRKI